MKPQHVENIRRMQRRLGVESDGVPGPVTLAAFEAMADRAAQYDADRARDTIPTGLSPGGQSLRLLALQWCLDEAERWGVYRVTADRVAQYFEGCERAGKNIGRWLASEVRRGHHYSFCAAAQGYAESQVAIGGDLMPPHRAGALEMMRDAIDHQRPGEKFTDAALIRSGTVSYPPPGSIAVYTRGGAPGNGHVERVIEAGELGFRSVGANEDGGRWVVDEAPQPYTKTGLLGFIVPEDHR